MSWFPKFLSLKAGLWAAAIAVPLLLVLYFLKLRRREQDVSSTLLWRRAIQDLQVNAPFQKLRKNLLLFLQLLLLVLLCLALSRPVANYSPGAAKLSVILVDRSASMSALDGFNGRQTTRLQEAQRLAKALVDTMGKNDTATVIAFDDSAEIVQPFTTDTMRLKSAIDSIEPTDRRTRLKTAYKLAEAQAHYLPEQLRPIETPTVYLYSDGRVADADELSLRGDLIYTRIGSEDAPNVGIVALSAKRNYDRPTEVQVFARLANFGPKPVQAEVELLVDGNLRGAATGDRGCCLYPERWPQDQRFKHEQQSGRPPKDSVEFSKIELTQAAVVQVKLHVMGDAAGVSVPDALAADDVASVVVPPPKTLSVLLVTDGNYYLEKAIHSLNLQNPQVLSPVIYETNRQKIDGKYDVILFDSYQPKWLPQVGNFIYFGLLPDGLKLTGVKDKNANVLVPKSRVLDWNREHPILRGLLLGRLEIPESLKLQTPLPQSSEVLMEGYNGPLIVLHREGRSTHLLIGFDILQSDWPLKLSFPVFMQNALEFMAVGTEMGVRESYPPGATPRIPALNIRQAGSPQKITLDGPIHRVLAVPQDDSDFVLPALNRVGVYTLSPAVPGYEKVAVNLLDPNESNLIPESLSPGGIGQTVTASSKSRLDLWWWIVACAALPLILIEWWVYARRVHL